MSAERDRIVLTAILGFLRACMDKRSTVLREKADCKQSKISLAIGKVIIFKPTIAKVEQFFASMYLSRISKNLLVY